MNLSENFESVKNFAMGAAQTATQKAKVLAAVAKANVSIYAEEDKIRKAEAQLGKLYYRDYVVGEEMDTAEYLPWCQKIDESKKLIAELKDYIPPRPPRSKSRSQPTSPRPNNFPVITKRPLYGHHRGGIFRRKHVDKAPPPRFLWKRGSFLDR